MRLEDESVFLDRPVQFDVYRPSFHLQPYAGWLNDPNGPLYYKGKYHMFYQHLPEACEWDFGIVWGHSVSEDLVHWRQLPPALVPTPGSPDADGCFSGCCTIDAVTGVPIILYTGVRLRSNAASGPPPPEEHDLGLVWIESQMAAIPADPTDDLLVHWVKKMPPFLALPPNHVPLTGWRDPFIYTANTASSLTGGFAPPELRMLIGSGIKGQGGSALVYTSDSVLGDWEFAGELCAGSSLDTGFVWECPLLVPLQPLPPGPSDDAGEERLGAGLGGASLPPAPQPPYWLLGETGEPPPTLSPYGSGIHLHLPLGRQGQVQGRRRGSDGSAPLDPRSGSGSEADSDVGAGSGTVSEADTPRADGSLRRRDSFEFDPSASQAVLTDLDRAPSIEFWRSPTIVAGAADGARSPPVGADADNPAAPDAAGASASQDAGHSSGSDCAGSGRAARRHGAAAQADSRQTSAAFDAALRLEGGAAVGGGSGLASRRLALDRAATLDGWAAGDVGTGPGLQIDAGRAEEEDVPGAMAGAQPPAQPPAPLPPFSSVMGSPPRPPPVRLSTTAGAGSTAPVPAPAPAPTAPAPTTATPAAPTGPADSRGRPIGLNLPAQARQRERSEDAFASFRSRLLSIRPKRTASVEQRISRMATAAAGSPDTRLLSGGGSAGAHAVVGPESDGVNSARSSTDGDATKRQWHFFSVSPDAPTNPVLFWMGHVDGNGRQFELEHAKGPFRLDLGDVLYAPNVLQDGHGRWLLWGWLQEKRKVGSYDYAGCLTVPRELHATPDGRLVQAPVPEINRLRRGPGTQLRDVELRPDQAHPLTGLRGDCLDVVLTLERGTAHAAGVLFESFEAGDEGGAALLFNWATLRLEVVFGVPRGWTEGLPGMTSAMASAMTSAMATPRGAAAGGAVVPAGGPVPPAGGRSSAWEHVDPALLLTTPRYASTLLSGASTPNIFSPGPFAAGEVGEDLLAAPAHLGGIATRTLSSVASGVTHLGGMRKVSSYLRLSSGAAMDDDDADLPDDLAEVLGVAPGAGGAGGHPPRDPGVVARRSADSTSTRSGGVSRNSVEAGLSTAVHGLVRAPLDAGAVLGRLAKVSLDSLRHRHGRHSTDDAHGRHSTDDGHGTDVEPASARSAGAVSHQSTTASEPGTAHASQTPQQQQQGGGGATPRLATMLSLPLRPISRTASFLSTPRQTGGAEAGQETLEQLLEELAGAPARETGPVPPPPQELRRVGGPLSMRSRDPLHLRILLDHSALEVFTGTGEVLSTRLYRGSPPPGAGPGIELVAFGDGPAHVRSLSAWELEALDAKTASVPLSPVVSPRSSGAGAGDQSSTPTFRADALFDQLVSGLDEAEGPTPVLPSRAAN